MDMDLPAAALSDQDILGQQYWLPSDVEPEDLPDLLAMIRPADDEKPKFEYLYDRTPSKGTTRAHIVCAHCKHPNHFKGYVLRYLDGSRVLIGKTCGGHHYGVWFHTMEKEFKARMSRSTALMRLKRASQAFPPAIAELAALIEAGWFEEAVAPAIDFQKRFRKMTDGLLTASDGILMSPIQVRNYEAENQRGEKIDREIRRRAQRAGLDQDEYAKRHRDAIASDPSLQKPPIWMTVEREFGRLQGIHYLQVALKKPREKADELLVALRSLGDRCANLNTQELSTSDILKEAGTARRFAKQITDQIDALARAGEFFALSNLRMIAQWGVAKGSEEGTYMVKNGSFVLELRDKHAFSFTPWAVRVPTKTALQSLWRQLTN